MAKAKVNFNRFNRQTQEELEFLENQINLIELDTTMSPEVKDELVAMYQKAMAEKFAPDERVEFMGILAHR